MVECLDLELSKHHIFILEKKNFIVTDIDCIWIKKLCLLKVQWTMRS
jgi:hypothetical protein